MEISCKRCTRVFEGSEEPNKIEDLFCQSCIAVLKGMLGKEV